jgi:hypothetical protein
MARKYTPKKRYFIIIPLETIQSQEYKNLSYPARLIYQSMICQWRRDKPDAEIEISYDKIKSDINTKSNSLITRGIKQLIKEEFIIQTVKGGLEKNVNHYKLVYKWLTIFVKKTQPP